MLTGHFTDVKEEKPQMPAMQATIRWLIGEAEGARGFAMRAIEIKHRGENIPLHERAYEHEVFVFEGRGSVLNLQGLKPIGPGDYVFVRPNERHGFANEGDGPFRFICVMPMPNRA